MTSEVSWGAVMNHRWRRNRPSHRQALVMLLTLAACTPQPSGPTSLDVSTWRVQAVQGFDLRVRYPPQWHLQLFEEEVGHVGFQGVGVVSVDRDLQHPHGTA
jgi:hypothetical protein